MSKRRLDSDERALWTHVTRSVSPLKKRRRAHDADDESTPALKVQTKAQARKPVAVAPFPAPRVPSRPEPAPLGRKAKRRIARDSDAIHARLDLHGMTQAEAHDALIGFLRSAQAQDARVVLVITGKGGRGAGERGVLKRQVPMWLRLPEVRDMVVGFETAGIGHGGEGALYVRIRRLRGD